MTTGPAGGSAIGRRGLASIAAASLVAAGSGYVVLVVVARHVSPAQNADFLVYWSLLFAGFGVLGGLQQEATRAVGSSRYVTTEAGKTRPLGAPVLPPMLLVGVVLAAAAALASPWWRSLLGAETGSGVVLLLCSALALYAGHLTLVGSLAGGRRWGTSSVLIAGESLLRVCLVVAAVLLGASLFEVEVAATLSVAFWLLMLTCSGKTRGGAAARADVGSGALLSRTAQAMVASAGAAALVVGYPTILRATTTDTVWTGAAPLVLAISMTRAPLLLPLGAFQGVAISYFLDPHRRRSAALARVCLAIIVVGAVGAGLAFLVGPALMALFFGETYRVDGLVLAGLTLASTALAVLTMTGSALLALGRHLAYAAGWTVATLVALVILLTGLSLDARAIVSLAAGPMAGIVVHGVAAMRTPRGTANEPGTSVDRAEG